MKHAVSVIAALSSLCAAAAEFKSPRLRNEGFEKGFFEWGTPEGAWRLIQGAGREKSAGLVCAKPSKKGPSQRLAIEGGNTYRFGAWVRTSKFGANGAAPRPKIVLRWFNWSEKLCGEAVATPAGDNNPNAEGWLRYEGTASPKNGPYGDLAVEFPDGVDGEVVLDDFYFLIDGGKPVGALTSDVYRNKAVDGMAKFAVALNVNTIAHPLDTLCPRFVFEGADGSQIVRKPDVFASDKAIVAINVAEIKKGASLVRFELTGKGDAKLGTARLTFFRIQSPTQRRVTFDRFNRTYVDGKLFFPLGMFANRLNKAELDIYRKGPFNCILPYRMADDTFDLCRDAGVFCVPSIISYVNGVRFTRKGCETRESSLKAIESYVRRYRNHPALLAWYTCDEAPLRNLPTMTEVHDLVNDLDPNHPVYIVLDRPEHVRQYMPAFDVIGLDPYPIGNNRGGIETAYGWAAEAKTGMYSFRPMWNVPQAYNWYWHAARRKAAGNDPTLKFPTREEFRSMIWQSIAAGANGLIPYSFGDMRYNAKPDEFPVLWSMVCEEMSQIATRTDILLSEPGPEISELPSGTAARTWRLKGRVFVLVCNLTRAPVEGLIRVGASVPSLKCSFGGPVSAKDGCVRVRLPAVGVTLFSVAE